MEPTSPGEVPRPAGTQVWRVDPVLRGFGLLWIVLSAIAAPAAVVAGYSGVEGFSPAIGFIVAVMFLGTVPFVRVLLFRPYLLADDHGILVRNVTDQHRLSWNEIQSITPGYFGLAIERRGDPVVYSSAIQKSNYAQARGNHTTRSDVIAVELSRRAAAGGAPTAPALPSAEQRQNAGRTARWVMLGGAGLIVLRVAVEFV